MTCLAHWSAAVVLCLFSGPALAQSSTGPVGKAAAGQAAPATATGTAQRPSISIELNKLDTASNACRAYFVVDNRTPDALKEMRINVFLFDKGGLILRPVGLTFSDVRSGRMKVILFELADLACADIGRLLVNDVLACTDASGAAIGGCADMISVSTRADAAFDY